MQCPVEAFPHIIQVFTKCIDRVCNVHGCFNKTVLILVKSYRIIVCDN